MTKSREDEWKMARGNWEKRNCISFERKKSSEQRRVDIMSAVTARGSVKTNIEKAKGAVRLIRPEKKLGKFAS